MEVKLPLYADDILCFLEHQLTLISEFCCLIEHFGGISGYKVNKDQFFFFGWHQVLGINICRSHDQMVAGNIDPIIK